MKSARTMKIVARIVVVFVKKSDVLRTPNTVPRLLVPSTPAKPPPLLACMSTAIMSRMLTSTSIAMKIVYITVPY
jgi:hypothetical protein